MVGVAAIALVAHVSVIDGHATLQRAEGGQIVALRNEPVLTGDGVATGTRSDAEIALGGSVFVRLDANSAVQVVSLVQHHREIRLLYGTLAISAQSNADSPRLDTPSITLAPDAPGLFRVGLTAGQTSLVAQRGTIRIVTPNGIQVLGKGEVVTASGDASAPTLSYGMPTPADDFDAFNQTRDAVELQHATDLSAYGTTVTIAGKQSAWRPSESRGWSPYAQGRWRYRARIGWTWIAQEPWGWLPYHYGNWVYDTTEGWVWISPSTTSSPSWSGSNAIFFAEIAGGHAQAIGWVALGPGEPFHARLQAYRNANAPGGIHVIDVPHFYSGDFSGVKTAALANLPSVTRQQAPRPPPTIGPRPPR